MAHLYISATKEYSHGAVGRRVLQVEILLLPANTAASVFLSTRRWTYPVELEGLEPSTYGLPDRRSSN